MVTVLLFGAVRERCGAARVTVSPCPADVGALKRVMEERHPFLKGKWGSIRVAVNQEFTTDARALLDSDEVALIPPVAGGSGPSRVTITSQPLSLDAAVAQVMTPQMGGLCVFAGLVRNHAQGHAVSAIEYSAYEQMAAQVVERMVAAAEGAHQARVACHHRVGRLEVGEMAVVIAAAAPHRAECFAAARQVIEALKKDAPIWKKEFADDGAVWVGMGP